MRAWLIIVTISLLGTNAQAQYSGGSGTADDPYQLATAADLIALGETPDDYDKHFILTADIDLDPNLPGRTVFDRAVIAPDSDDTEDGFQGTPFAGVFDGNNHTISHLMIEGANWLGLFGRSHADAQITGLGLVDANVVGTGGNIGLLVGRNLYGSITASYSTGAVTGDFHVGGLVGFNLGSIATSYSAGMVSGDRCIGGLVGTHWGSVTQCWSTAVVDGSSRVGGLVGWNYGDITTSYSIGDVTGTHLVGGLVGWNCYYRGYYKDTGIITNCYSTGAVSGESTVGGLVGCNEFSITACYSTGSVAGNEEVGGLVGLATGSWRDRNYGFADMCFWDVETSGQSTSDGGSGKTTAEMQAGDTFLVWGVCGNEAIWTIDESRDYPRLWWEESPGEPIVYGATLSEFLAGTGTEEDPYLIYTANELNLIGLFPCGWDKQFQLMSDIDLSGFWYDAAVIAPSLAGSPWGEYDFKGPPFTGVFDGNGHTISCLTITGDSYLGLFGLLGFEAEVRNLGVVDANITGSYAYIGTLASSNRGTVSGSYCTGTVSGGQSVGGLVGSNWDGLITTSYSMSEVTGDRAVGGLVGENWGGTVTASYSMSEVAGNERVGGLAGSENEGNITVSFWDTETSGQVTSAGGAGLTTTEMQTASTFLEAGWDFIDETENGTDDIWWIDEGQDYPRLWWELVEDDAGQ
jgi:GLUG motif-containing protein